ncbi:MAG TPA: hypothetical protein VNU26_14035 [Mycobacteriales bacterium]|nr:hypothetical protein [Mycobacteriales bacterium]HWH30050.1 hypothetical protein [Mycobacteriales bacterium]
MSVHHHVPADDEPTSIIDLLEDCREVSGVLAPYVPTEIRLPGARGALPVEIDATVAAGVDSWGDYGS